MTIAEAAARYFCDLQPRAVRSRLMKSERFQARAGLPGKWVMLNTIGVVAAEDLFSAARDVISAGASREIVTAGGVRASLSLEQDAVTVSSADNQGRVSLKALMALSSRPEQRLATLKDMKDWLGPTGKKVAALIISAEDRSLRDDEMLDILEDLRCSIARWHEKLGAAIATANLGLAEIAPHDLSYYEKLGGPHPESRGPEEYIQEVLVPYRRDLVTAEPKRGLELCLLGCLRDDLALSGALGGVTDSDLWQIIGPLRTAEDPFTLLGVLEIAISRSSDSRFLGMAEEVAGRLGSLELRRADGTDVYEIMPPIAAAILRRLNTCENGIKRPPYWRRFAAWVQAGVMIRMLEQSKIEGEPFIKWLDQAGPSAGQMRSLVDLRLEPMWSAFEMTPNRLRGEVLGRLFGLLSRWEHSGASLPESIRIAFERDLSSQPEALFEACMPGPLEGHRRSGSSRLLEGNLIEATRVWVGRLEGPQCRQAWAFLGQVAQALPFEDTVLAKMGMQVREARIAEEPGEGEISFDDLGWAGMIAAAHRDRQLGDAVGQRCVAEAEKVRSAETATAFLHSLLIAAASCPEQGQWRSWVESNLFDLAARLPFGQPNRTLSKWLEDLKIVMPMEDDVWSKAESMAALGS